MGYVNSQALSSYAKILGYDANHPLVSFAIVADHYDSSYIKDSYATGSGKRTARIGGYYGSNEYNAGLWAWHMNFTSDIVNGAQGARLLRYQ